MAHIGSDEAGKGDYFGYLVVVAVRVDEECTQKLEKLNVRDSKRIADNVVIALSEKIKKICKHDIVRISPTKYNKMYKKTPNLNKILAWAHARAIENVLSKAKADYAIIDKFGSKHYIEDALMSKSKEIRIIQKPRAERDMAVAAASILARATFLLTLQGLGKKYNITLPKGATHVKPAAEKLVKLKGEKILDKLVKKHFKITKQLRIIS
ncbi:ribonuclease HIII [archaeon]|nr:ribonuclease HIII [archaeon]|tara:strand:+ start:56 stop:685 length:630 start_codon:yes stop_codon:yes gene_type:complete